MVSVTKRHVTELARAVPISVEWSHFSFESDTRVHVYRKLIFAFFVFWILNTGIIL